MHVYACHSFFHSFIQSEPFRFIFTVSRKLIKSVSTNIIYTVIVLSQTFPNRVSKFRLKDNKVNVCTLKLFTNVIVSGSARAKFRTEMDVILESPACTDEQAALADN
jgi:hypothetical protein